MPGRCENGGLMKQRIILWLTGLLSLCCLSSCLEVEQVINLKKDGSGTIVEEIVMGAQIVAMMEALPAGAGEENPFADLYNVENYKAKAAGCKCPRTRGSEPCGWCKENPEPPGR